MTKVKNVILAIILIMAISFKAKSQSRESQENATFATESNKLAKATGWAKNGTTGKWQENKNVIDSKKCSSFWVSHVFQNFKWLQFSTIIKNDEKYHVFLYEKLAGEYKYPNIHTDWESEKRTYFFILTEEKYTDFLTKIDLKTGEDFVLSSKMEGYITDKYKILRGEHLYNKENLLAKITRAIEKPSYSEYDFILNSQTVDGIDVVRFKLPSKTYFKKSLESSYFEVTTSVFKTILLD